MTTPKEAGSLSPLKRALIALEEMQARLDGVERARREPIAIVGAGCRLPGGASDPEAFWHLLRDGVDAVSEIPPDRWDVNAYYDPDPDAPGKMSVRHGAFLADAYAFDPAFFGISPREAASMDPQQRLLLEVAWEALEHAGLGADGLWGSRTGVYVGICRSDYANLQLKSGDPGRLDLYFASGQAHSIASGRLSYILGLQGPSLSIDTACSSSLVALHLAVESLRRGETNLGLVAGGNLILSPENTITFAKAHMLAPDGRCKTFDARADGFVSGEGFVALVLKRLADAQADGSRVLAVIRGTAVNQDGPSSGLTAPNGPAQQAVIREALAAAGISPARIGYVEAHGTGTALGDPIEVQALGAVLCEGRPADRPLLIGSVKTNVGHLEAAAGLTGVLKLVLALQHNAIPPHLHFQNPSPHIPWDELPFVVPTSLTPWPRTDGPRCGGVSAFGFSGTNAHVILEEGPAPPSLVPAAAERPLHLLTLSAKSALALQALAARYASHLPAHPEQPWADVCHTASAGRAHLPHRLALVAETSEQATRELAAIGTGGVSEGIEQGTLLTTTRPRVAFLCTGQGAQYVGMGRELYRTQPVFREALDRCAESLRPHLEHPLLGVMWGEAGPAGCLDQTGYTQPALFALEVALAELWRSWGVTPTWVLGHSVGEVVAAVVAGVLTLEDGGTLIATRAKLMQALPPAGAMLAVRASAAQVAPLLAPYAAEVALAAVNGPASVVISGRRAAVAQVQQALVAAGVSTTPLAVSHAFHSPLMDPMLADFERVAAGLTSRAPQVGLISNLTGRLVQAGELDAAYWRRHVREAVQFQAGMATLQAQGAALFLEVGPAPVLCGLGQACLPAGTGPWLPSLRKGRGDWATLLPSLAALYVRGVPIDWVAFDRPYPRRTVSLPTYPFQRREHRLEQGRTLPTRSNATDTSFHPFLGRPVRSPLLKETLFESALNTDRYPFLADHKVHGIVIMPGAALLEMAVAATEEAIGESVLEDVVIQETLVVPSEGARAVQVVLAPEGDEGCTLRVISVDPAVEGENKWRVHLTAKARRISRGVVGESVPLAVLRARCGESVDVSGYYDRLSKTGIDLGPAFRGLEELWRGDGEALARICLPEAAGPVGGYRIGPSLLDAGFSAVGAAVSWEELGDAYLPFAVDALRCHGRLGEHVWSHARVREGREPGRATLTADVALLDDDGRVLVDVTGLRLKRVGETTLLRREIESEQWLYGVEWRSWPSKPRATDRGRQALPAPAVIAERLEPCVVRLGAQHGVSVYNRLLPALDALCAAYIVRSLRLLGWTPRIGERVVAGDLAHRLGVKDAYWRLFGRLLEILQEERLLRVLPGSNGAVAPTTEWEVVALPQAVDPQRLAEECAAAFPEASAEREITVLCGEQLAAVLRGEADPLALLFPGGSFDAAEKLYQDSPAARVIQATVRDAVSAAVEALPEDRSIRILEIGAGTGGTTEFVLPALPAVRTEYTFTDISPLFAARARDKFAQYPFLRFEVLDIEQDPMRQGFPSHGYDIVVAANVLHATRDLRETLRHIRRLLAADGLLVVVEVAARQRWVDLTFGLLDGWWRFADTELRPDYPLLTHPRWLSLLEEEGFRGAVKIPGDTNGARILEEHGVLLARGPADPAALETGRWLMLADRGGVAAGLAESLRSRGHECVLAFADTTPSEGLGRLLREAAGGHALQGVIHLWGLDEASSRAASTSELEAETRRGTGSALELVSALGKVGLPAAPRLWLVTRGAQPAGPVGPLSVAQSPLWGLAKVIALEHPEVACTCVDLDPAAPVGAAVAQLFAEVIAPETESQIAFRGGIRHVARLVRAPLRQSAARKPERLEMGRPGDLDDLSLVPFARRAPGPGEVEIEVHASGLNFRDVLNALGMRSDDQPLGGECSGRIAAVGERVLGLTVGDAVVAVCPDCFASFVTTSAELVLSKPTELTFEEAATIPLAFLTAQHALLEIGKLRAGERVLIHAAAGGVGLAGVQLAQRAGAEVLATAGSPAKREFLRSLGIRHVMDSRSLTFADEIAAVTGGAGVDVVLNSLTGEFIPKSLSILAPGGRFVEIGKADLWDPARVAALRPDVSYLVVDLAATLRDRPASVRPELSTLFEAVAHGKLRRLPVQVFSVAEAPAAFRFMAQARHIGKIVLTQPMRRETAVVPDGTYLITGGLAGLGLRVAGWLVERGARHLVLMGRRLPTEAARTAIREMEAAGAQVAVAQGDVTQEARVKEILADISTAGPPLRGIIHAAGVLDDGVLLQQTWERFARVLAPKVAGAWNLHRLTEGIPLDFFVLFSSVAALLGSPGQGNHAAANAFLDALAHHRRALGLPATSINWGVWSEVGAAAARGVAGRAGLQGIGNFAPEEGLRILGQVLAVNPVQLGVMPVNWARLVKAVRIESPFLAGVVPRDRGAAPVDQETGPVTTGPSEVRKQIEEAPTKDRRRLLFTYVRARAAKVLGLNPTEEVDVRQPLSEMGLDSLMAVELRTVLGTGLGLTKSLPATLVFDHPSIVELADYLGREALHLEMADAQPESEPAAAGIGGVLDRIEQLSEDEVERLFRGGTPGSER